MRNLNIALFCGGRGSQALIREALRRSDVNITLLVNAYDDGLSTGTLRALIPGMLGPSDFRKNLSYLLSLYSPAQLSLQKAIEYRFPKGLKDESISILERYAHGHCDDLPPEFRAIHDGITTPDKIKKLRHYVGLLITYLKDSGRTFNISDCSFGNLVFAGIYLSSGENFNKSTALLADLVDAQGRLVNVSAGENRTLTALKENGEILSRESEVVGEQSPAFISDIFFTEGPVPSDTRKTLEKMSLPDKREWFQSHALSCKISPECHEALMAADIIIYGPGTQHSSLFPSYLIAGDEIRQSPAKVKILVANLRFDHDIHGYSVNKLMEQALHYLGDPDNAGRSITHVLANEPITLTDDSIVLKPVQGKLPEQILGATVVNGCFSNPNNPNIHSGFSVLNTAVGLYRKATQQSSERTIEVYFDLSERSILIDHLMQEISEIDWRRHFDRVSLVFRSVENIPTSNLPDNVSVRLIRGKTAADPWPDVLKDWAKMAETEYLAIIEGDGEYRVRDLERLVDVSLNSGMDAVFGTRAQSRRQLDASLSNAYGDGFFVRLVSRLGMYVVSNLYLLRFGVMFSDPMTGMILLRRSNLAATAEIATKPPASSAALLRMLIKAGDEVCEVPVSYRTYPSFTDVRWRLKRGFHILAGLFK